MTSPPPQSTAPAAERKQPGGAPPAPAEPSTAAAAAEPPPRLAEGVELVGEFEDSGFNEAPYIARRADGQLDDAVRESRVEVWSGTEDRLLRRLRLRVEFRAEVPRELRDDLGRLAGARLTFDLELGDPNRPVEVRAPKAPALRRAGRRSRFRLAARIGGLPAGNYPTAHPTRERVMTEEPHNPGEPEFGDKHGGDHNPGEPKFGEGDRPENPAEGTSPPGNPERDEEAIRQGEDKLHQAGH